jgi:hypothetical protein
MGVFGKVEVSVPRARIKGADGKTTEWHSKTLRKYQRRTKAADDNYVFRSGPLRNMAEFVAEFLKPNFTEC